jgi:Zn-finger nucleic acid-binding protein
MLRCQSCSAPLPGFKARCEYCGTVNDVDRELLSRTAVPSRASAYPCPSCGKEMKNLELGAADAETVAVDQCQACFGLFFPFYKLEILLNDLARYAFLVDAKRLEDLSRNASQETRIAYRRCPVCAKLMNRINFGRRSGVITDQCFGHGVWLDAGELKRLVEWKNSGGKIVDDQYRKEQDALEEKRRQREKDKLERLKREARNSGA